MDDTHDEFTAIGKVKAAERDFITARETTDRERQRIAARTLDRALTDWIEAFR